MIDRLAFGFHNPNHAAALACALLPLCWGWRRWLGRLLSLALFLALLTTQSRTGLVVALSEAATWWRLRKGRFRVSHLGSHKLAAAGIAAFAVAALWRMWPRMALDGSMLNRPKIWLAGLRLFAASPDGVGLGNSGALWGEDDTRRVLPRARIDPKYANPLYTPAMAALWKGE